MIKKIAIFLLLVGATISNTTAQTVMQGTVLDEHSRSVDAFVAVSPKGNGSMIAYADTDDKGNYKLEFKTDADSVIVTVTGLGIGNQARVVANRSQKLNFTVKEETTELKEVSVKAQKIRQEGDTLSYLVGSYQEQGDRVIGDVLKRMPGIEVSDDGGIKYNGKAIKKFYVEEMDLLQGRYGLATNNINASDVASVQVLENHQPVKMLQGKELTDDVAINLKLKDSAKGTVAINMMIGAGAQQASGWGFGSRSLDRDNAIIGQNPLWTGELVGMFFTRTRQNMTLYKSNNTGDDVSKELTEHYSGINSVGLFPFCPIGAILPSGSGLPQKRTFDNHSHIFTMNHLEKFKNDHEVGVNVAYHNDNIRQEGNSVSNRFISDDSRLLTQETLASETKINNLNIQVHYTKNAFDGFITNVLKFDTNWNSDRVYGMVSSESTGVMPVNYGNEHVRQHFDRPELSISNTFNTIKNIGENSLNLHFSAGYSQRPNTLNAEIDSLQEGTQTTHTQDVTSRHIAGRFSTDYNLHVGDYFTFSYGINAYANLHGIVTDLYGSANSSVNMLPGSLQNDLWYNTYSATLNQSYKFEKRNVSITLGLPLNLYTQSLDDRIRDDEHSYTHLLISPSLNMWWDITRDLSLTVGANYSKNVGDPSGIYSGYIMSNYRSFQRSYVEQLSETKNYGANANLRYRNALQAIFANVGFNYRRHHDNQIYGYSYEGATSVVQAVNQPTISDNYSVSGDASKGFDFLRSTIRIFGNYSLSQSERLIADNLYQFQGQSFNYGGSLSFSPFEWIGIVYSCGFANSRSYTKGNENGSTAVRSNTQRLSMSIYPTKKLTLTLSAEDNYNNLTATNRHAWFGDAKAKLKLKLVDLELQFNNLFDQRQYTRVNYSGLDIYTQTSQLRPRNIVASVRFKLL